MHAWSLVFGALNGDALRTLPNDSGTLLGFRFLLFPSDKRLSSPFQNYANVFGLQIRVWVFAMARSVDGHGEFSRRRPNRLGAASGFLASIGRCRSFANRISGSPT
jgi:hypothetical protein